MKKIASALFIPIIFFSCVENSVEFDVQEELAPYIEKFIEEGAKRGVDLSTDDLVALLINEFSAQPSDNACGLGWSSYEGQNTQRIEILATESCWTSKTDLQKENLVFHELGHALLGRDHFDEQLSNGVTYKSIMCGAACNNFEILPAEGTRRKYYLDELFDENTTFPLVEKQFNRILLQEDFENYDTSWQVYQWYNKSWELVSGIDEENKYQYSVNADSSSIINNETEHALVVSNSETIIDSARVIVLKRFDVSDYKECSNIIARANIRTEGLTDDGFSSFNMALSLRDRKENGELERFLVETKTNKTFTSVNNTFENFEFEMYCLPPTTDVVTISFRVGSTTPATFFVDDVVLELWD